MTDYNRFTTQKGQLLLNINPPSRTYNLDKSGVNLSNSNNSGVPNTPPYKIYQPQHQLYNIKNSPPNPYLQSNLLNQQVNSRQLRNIANQPYSISNRIPAYTSTPHQFQQTHQIGSRYDNSRTKRQIYQQKPFNRPVKGNSAFDELGENDSDNSQKRYPRKQDQTICCFPAYWLLLILIGAVFGSFLLILLKEGVFNNSNLKNNTAPQLQTSFQIDPYQQTQYRLKTQEHFKSLQDKLKFRNQEPSQVQPSNLSDVGTDQIPQQMHYYRHRLATQAD